MSSKHDLCARWLNASGVLAIAWASVRLSTVRHTAVLCQNGAK